MKVLGLTGGVGMGKSACARLLEGRGVATVDTDELARKIVEPGEPALEEIQKVFGANLVDTEGRLKRDALAAVVFSNAEARLKLERILHPRIRDLWKAQIIAWQKEGRPLGAVIIPLLFETQVEAEFDAILCVACSANTQQKRLEARGWSQEQLHQRIAAQTPIDEKMLRSNYVIWTEAGMDVHAEQLDRILSSL